MSDQTASPKRMFTNCVQIGVVVKDLDRTLKALTEVFGLGPFRTITYPPPDRTDIERVYKGSPASFVFREAFADLGSVELEIIQPLDGESIWSDFLKEHGEGLHHIRFNVPDLQPVIRCLAEQGIDVAMMGSGLRPGTTWAHFDTASMIGFTLEVVKTLPGTDGRTPQIVDGKVQV